MDGMLRFVAVGLGGEEGQTLIEYVFILVLIAIVVILMLIALGGTVNNTYSVINSAMP